MIMHMHQIKLSCESVSDFDLFSSFAGLSECNAEHMEGIVYPNEVSI